jgi:hypothetical protein
MDNEGVTTPAKVQNPATVPRLKATAFWVVSQQSPFVELG